MPSSSRRPWLDSPGGNQENSMTALIDTSINMNNSMTLLMDTSLPPIPKSSARRAKSSKATTHTSTESTGTSTTGTSKARRKKKSSAEQDIAPTRTPDVFDDMDDAALEELAWQQMEQQRQGHGVSSKVVTATSPPRPSSDAFEEDDDDAAPRMPLALQLSPNIETRRKKRSPRKTAAFAPQPEAEAEAEAAVPAEEVAPSSEPVQGEDQLAELPVKGKNQARFPSKLQSPSPKKRLSTIPEAAERASGIPRISSGRVVSQKETREERRRRLGLVREEPQEAQGGAAPTSGEEQNSKTSKDAKVRDAQSTDDAPADSALGPGRSPTKPYLSPNRSPTKRRLPSMLEFSPSRRKSATVRAGQEQAPQQTAWTQAQTQVQSAQPASNSAGEQQQEQPSELVRLLRLSKSPETRKTPKPTEAIRQSSQSPIKPHNCLSGSTAAPPEEEAVAVKAALKDTLKERRSPTKKEIGRPKAAAASGSARQISNSKRPEKMVPATTAKRAKRAEGGLHTNVATKASQEQASPSAVEEAAVSQSTGDEQAAVQAEQPPSPDGHKEAESASSLPGTSTAEADKPALEEAQEVVRGKPEAEEQPRRSSRRLSREAASAAGTLRETKLSRRASPASAASVGKAAADPPTASTVLGARQASPKKALYGASKAAVGKSPRSKARTTKERQAVAAADARVSALRAEKPTASVAASSAPSSSSACRVPVKRMPSSNVRGTGTTAPPVDVPSGFRLTSAGNLVPLAEPTTAPGVKPFAPSAEHYARMLAATEEQERVMRERALVKAHDVPEYLRKRREELEAERDAELQRQIEAIRAKELADGPASSGSGSSGPGLRASQSSRFNLPSGLMGPGAAKKRSTSAAASAKAAKPFVSALESRKMEREAWEQRRAARDALLETERAKAREEKRRMEEEELKRERDRRVPRANPVPEEIYGAKAKNVKVEKPAEKGGVGTRTRTRSAAART